MQPITTPGVSIGTARESVFPFDAPVCGIERLIGVVIGANVNQANTDIAIPLQLLQNANFVVTAVYVNNASTSLTTATFGVFNQTGGSGAAIVTAGAVLSSLTSATANLSATLNAAGSTNVVLNAGTLGTANTLYFRVGTAQGSPATCDVYIWGKVLT